MDGRGITFALGNAGLFAPLPAGAQATTFSFVQISDSHIGFHQPANIDVAATLEATVNRINALSVRPAFVIHTGDITHLAKPEQFDRAKSRRVRRTRGGRARRDHIDRSAERCVRFSSSACAMRRFRAGAPPLGILISSGAKPGLPVRPRHPNLNRPMRLPARVCMKRCKRCRRANERRSSWRTFGARTQAQIAAQLGLPLGTVKSRASLAPRKLAMALGPST